MAVERIACLSFTTADAARLAAFYEAALGFERVGMEERDGASFARLMGLSSARARAQLLRIGTQTLELLEFSSAGLPYPVERSGNDPFFQHIAIVVTDMQAAYARLRASTGWTAITSPAPQLLPPTSGGVSAFKFRDPEGHPLELLQFPPAREPSFWSAKPRDTLFLGVDHSAIVVADTARSIAFYQGLLGMSVAYRSLNRGVEQDRLDGLHDAVVEVTGLAPRINQPPRLELLCYRAPAARNVRSAPFGCADIASTRVVFEVDDFSATLDRLAGAAVTFVGREVGTPESSGAALLRDPDAHALLLRGVPQLGK